MAAGVCHTGEINIVPEDFCMGVNVRENVGQYLGAQLTKVTLQQIWNSPGQAVATLICSLIPK